MLTNMSSLPLLSTFPLLSVCLSLSFPHLGVFGAQSTAVQFLLQPMSNGLPVDRYLPVT